MNEEIKEILIELRDIQTRLGRLEGFVYGRHLLTVDRLFTGEIPNDIPSAS